jgi:hypothetical protein
LHPYYHPRLPIREVEDKESRPGLRRPARIGETQLSEGAGSEITGFFRLVRSRAVFRNQ